MNPDIYVDKLAPRARRKPNAASVVKKPAAKKPSRKDAVDDLSKLSPTTRRLVEALRRLYGTA